MAEKSAATQKAAKKPGFFAKVKGWFGGVAKYLKDTRSELKKVVWPSKKDVKNNTVVVIAVVVIAAVFMLVLDVVFGGAIHLMIGA